MQPADNRILLAREIVKSIRVKSLVLLAFAFVGTVAIVPMLYVEKNFFVDVMEDADGGRYFFILALLLLMVYQMMVPRHLKRQIRKKGEEPLMIGYLNAVLEPSIVSFILLIELVNFRQDALLYSPAVLGYAIVIVLSSLHLSWRITLFCGLICTGEFLLLVVTMAVNYPVPGVLEYLPTQGMKALLIFMVACAAAFVAYRIHRGIDNMTRISQEKSFVVNVFGRYLTDEVAEHILKSPRGLQLGGEKRRVTLMMTDLRGFTHLSDRLPAEDIVCILNNYLEEMIEIIAHHQGTIDEIIGDGILVIFGAPLEAAHHAEVAVRCALEMQLAMGSINRWNRKHGFPDIDMGIGVHTGDVVVGNIGSHKRSKYGVVGREINLTSRIES